MTETLKPPCIADLQCDEIVDVFFMADDVRPVAVPNTVPTYVNSEIVVKDLIMSSDPSWKVC